MAQTIKRKKDPLVYAANLIGLAIILHICLRMLAQMLGGLVLQGAFEGVRFPDLEGVPEWGLGIYNLILPLVVLLPPFLLLQKAAGRFKISLPLGKSRIPVWLLLPLFLGAMVVVNSVSSMVAGLFGGNSAPAQLPTTAVGIALYFIYTCVLPAVLEEMLFRGMIQGLLRAWGSRFAILLSSLLFALLHTNLKAVIGVFFLSVLLGYVREVTRSVKPGMVLHFANNTASFLLLLGQTYLSGVAALALGFWLTLLFLILFAAAVWAVRYFHLGKKFRLPKDPPNEPGRPPLYKRLAMAPVFIGGVVAAVAYFVVSVVM